MAGLAELFTKNVKEFFSQRDSLRRAKALSDLWHPDGELRTTDGVFRGVEAIERQIAHMLRRYPEFDYTLTSSLNESGECAYATWALGSLDCMPALGGLNVMLVERGRISVFCRFLAGPAL